MTSSPTNLIIAADCGGTKGDFLLVDAESGVPIRRVQKEADTLPPELAPSLRPGRGGGRSVEMGNYCLGKLLEGFSPQKIHLIYTGLNYDESIFSSRGITEVNKFVCCEEDGIMISEECRVGICSILGTGATTMIYWNTERPFVIDALGPICGDWGGGCYIGAHFVRNVLREQNFTHGEMWETGEILSFLKGQMEKLGEPPVEKADASCWEIVRIFLRHYDRTFVASLARLCDSCARKGSSIARQVLENAGQEVAINTYRGAFFTGINALKIIPVIVSGSIFLHSDFVYESFCRTLQEKLPQAQIKRSFRPQIYGQTIKMLELLHGPQANSRIERFKQEAAELFSKTLCSPRR